MNKVKVPGYVDDYIKDKKSIGFNMKDLIYAIFYCAHVEPTKITRAEEWINGNLKAALNAVINGYEVIE